MSIRAPGLYWTRCKNWSTDQPIGWGDWELCEIKEPGAPEVWFFGWDIPSTIDENRQVVGPITIEPPTEG